MDLVSAIIPSNMRVMVDSGTHSDVSSSQESNLGVNNKNEEIPPIKRPVIIFLKYFDYKD